MAEIHVVVRSDPGYCREDEPTAGCVGAYTDLATADLARRLSGISARIISVEVDVIPPGLIARGKALGFIK